MFWNPPRYAFTIPYLEHPVAWYGILFTAGFGIGYFMMVSLLRRTASISKGMAAEIVDRLILWIVLGTLVGARLGHVFFYDWGYFQHHLLDSFKVWEGGLASHGAVVGILLALFGFYRWVKKRLPQLNLLQWMDLVAIPTALAACFIRLGNFVNQEIIGVPTSAPWAVIFGNPVDDPLVVPRHPVQLYEALAYLMIFFGLYQVWKSKPRPGILVGLFFIGVFGARFVLEIYKVHTDSSFDQSLLSAGQWLSIPCILLGAALAIKGYFGHNRGQKTEISHAKIDL